MYLIENITTDPRQKRTLILPDGKTITLEIYFVPMQLGWFITNLEYDDFQLKGIRITNQPNILYQWKNQIPFGLACFSQGDREPTLQDDFSTGASKLYILTEDEVEEYSDILDGQV